LFWQKKKEITDEELLALYKDSGDSAAFDQLFRRYSGFVFAICMKYLKNVELSKDMTMVVFEKLSVDLHRFEVRNLKPWVHTMTKNLCFMHFRSDKSKRLKLNELKSDAKADMENPAFQHQDEADNKETQLQNMEMVLQTIPENQRICLDLFYLKEMSYSEVSEKTGFTMNEVKSFIQNGKRNMKIQLLKLNEP
jgi:RNA polymerase sigma-70 factor (ECF subfamily)